MGVDADYYVLYGIDWEGPCLSERYDMEDSLFYYDKCVADEDSDYYGDSVIYYNYDKLYELGFRIIVEPYSLSWTVVGIDFLDSDVNKTIENLTKVHERWQIFIDALRNVGYEDKISEPSIISEGYFS